jgi:hypothetical protein
MRGLKTALIWIVCVVVGAIVGYLAGWALWKLGFELFGGAVALVCAAVGGIAIFFWLMGILPKSSPTRARGEIGEPSRSNVDAGADGIVPNSPGRGQIRLWTHAGTPGYTAIVTPTSATRHQRSMRWGDG